MRAACRPAAAELPRACHVARRRAPRWQAGRPCSSSASSAARATPLRIEQTPGADPPRSATPRSASSRWKRRARACAGSAPCCPPGRTQDRSSTSIARSRSDWLAKTSALRRPKPIRCCPPTMHAFLRRGPAALAVARAALEFAADAIDRYDAPDLLRAGVVEPRRRVRLWAPVPHPRKIIAVARNYPAHARERGAAAPPSEPVLFLKAPSAVIGPDDEILLPAAASRVDWEGELAVVIGSRARNVCAQDALACVAGYTRRQRRLRARFPERTRPALHRKVLRHASLRSARRSSLPTKFPTRRISASGRWYRARRCNRRARRR